MKWIGQQIYDLASRFRNDVFLEDISTGTIASGAHLGLDSNNKIVKAVDGGGDLTSIVAGTGLSGTSLTGPIPTLNVDASQTQITSVGTIGTGVWQGTTIKTAYIGDDQVTEDKLANTLLAEIDANTAKVTNVATNLTATTHASQITINSSDGTNVIVAEASGSIAGVMSVTHHDKLDAIEASATADQSKSDIDGLAITTVGTIDTGVWNGTAITAAYIAAAQTNITSLGTLTALTVDNIGINGDTITASGDLAIVATGNDITVDSDTFTMTSSTADAPTIKLVNTTNDDQTSQLIFEKLRADDAVAVGQNIGEIWFRGQDSAQNTQNYGFVLGEIDVSTSGQESGKVSLGIANHDGGNGRGLILTGGSENNEVDATVGLGANSVTTVAGTLTMGSTAAIGNTGLLTVGAQTGITACTNLVTVGTIGTGVWNGTAIASAYLDADTMHYSAQRQLTHHTIQDDIDTQVVFLSLTDFDAENTTIGNNKLPLIAPVAGKLLKVFVRCSHNLSGVDFTWKLYTRTSSQSTNGNAAEIGAQTGTGPTNGNMVTYDFTTGLDSGTNAIGAGDKVQISLETNGSTSNANFFITLMWEWNLS
tara:strand:+ start:3116 stop:4897 length:1782 start_codon:yes stop_codon:yes gene_type:complete